MLIYKLFKPFKDNDIIDISEYLGGKPLKIFISILYILFFIFFSGILLRYIANSLKIIYFEEIPLSYIMLFFSIPSAIVIKFGIKTISKINLIFIFLFFISTLVMVFSTISLFVPQRLFPILGLGINSTFLKGTVNICSFAGIAYLYFLIPMLEKPKDFKKVAISSTIISAIYLLINVLSLLMLFPAITFTDEMLSIYLIARLIEFGRFFQRIDALFIFIWILNILSFLSISLYFTCNIFKKITNIKDSSIMSYSFSGLCFSVALIIKNIAQIKYIQNVVLKYILTIIIFIISPIILIFAYIKKKRILKYEN